MKKSIIALLAVITCSVSYAQLKIDSFCNESEVKSLEEAVSHYWKWDNDSDPVKSVSLLEEFSKTHKNNWVGQYWASYISTQIANSIPDKSEEYISKAQQYLDESIKRFNNNKIDGVSPYFNTLQSLIYRLSPKNSKEQAQDLLNKATEELNMAIKADPENPVIMVMAATGLASNAKGNFSNIIASIALLEKAKKEFAKIKDRSPADITYWNEHWIDPWLKNLSPPKS